MLCFFRLTQYKGPVTSIIFFYEFVEVFVMTAKMTKKLLLGKPQHTFMATSTIWLNTNWSYLMNDLYEVSCPDRQCRHYRQISRSDDDLQVVIPSCKSMGLIKITNGSLALGQRPLNWSRHVKTLWWHICVLDGESTNAVNKDIYFVDTALLSCAVSCYLAVMMSFLSCALLCHTKSFIKTCTILFLSITQIYIACLINFLTPSLTFSNNLLLDAYIIFINIVDNFERVHKTYSILFSGAAPP